MLTSILNINNIDEKHKNWHSNNIATIQTTISTSAIMAVSSKLPVVVFSSHNQSQHISLKIKTIKYKDKQQRKKKKC